MTHYEVVSVDPTATLAQLKQARRDAAQLYHPDRLQQLPESVRALAEAQFKRINAAYDVLSDPAQQRIYDASLRADPPSMPSAASGTTSTWQRGARTSSTCDSSSTSSHTSPPRSERHARAWAALLANQRRRRLRFWMGTALSSVALLMALVVVLVAVATTWLPAPRPVPRPVWMGVWGVLAQLVALAGVARMAQIVIRPGEIIRFGVGMLAPALGTWFGVGMLFVSVLLIESSTAALRVVFIVPVVVHVVFCLLRVRRAVVRLDLVEQQRLLWHPVWKNTAGIYTLTTGVKRQQLFPVWQGRSY